MSLEAKIEALTETLERTISALSGLNLASTQEPTSDSTVKQEPESTKGVESTADTESKSEAKIAGRKTFIWNTETKTGQVVEKGDEVPEGDNLKNVRGPKFEELCKKYGCDPETGKPPELGNAEEKTDDLDLDEPETEATASEDDLDLDEGEADNSDDDLDLDLDDDDPSDPEELTVDEKAEVQASLIKVTKECKRGREVVLKILEKVGVSNIDALRRSHLEDLNKAVKAAMTKFAK